MTEHHSDGSDFDLDARDQVKAEVESQIRHLIGVGLEALATMYRNQLGQVYDDMANQRELAESGLCSHDAMTREAALALLLRSWGRPGEYCEECKRLALADPAERVRKIAIDGLWMNCLTECTRHDICAMLCAIILDEGEAGYIRLAAYKALIRTDADVAGEWDPPLARLRFPDDVNWEFVKSFRTS